jgi:hypothetical protein
MKRIAFIVVAALLVVSCGGSTPAAPTPTPAPTATPSPAAVASPSPSPVPAPTPDPTDGGEPPVTNSNPAARLAIRLYVVEDPGGGYINNPDPNNVPAGYTARIDVTAKDIDNRETQGQGELQFFFNGSAPFKVWGNHTNQRRITASGGQVDCWAIQDGARSAVLTLTFQQQ